jgi:O-antigen/teichoic acid export membrane protein
MNEVASLPPSVARDGWKSRIKSRVLLGLSLLRFEQFETESQDGRARERYRRVLLTAVTAGGARFTSLLMMFVSVPLIVHRFGPERYAVWATITSTVTLLVFADLGIGNGLLNFISESDGSGNVEIAIQAISTGFFVLLGIASIGALCFFVAYPFVPWQRIFNVTSNIAKQEAGPATLIFAMCFLLQLPLGVVQRAQLGYQEGYVTQVWNAAGNLVALLGLLFVLHVGAGLPYMVVAVAGAPVLVGILNSINFFVVRRPWLMPRLNLVSRAVAERILTAGFFFLVLQVTYAIGYQTDSLVLAQILGPNSVTVYSVTSKLFTILPSVFGLAMVPLWPAYGEALARGDVRWVRKTLRRSILIGVAILLPLNICLIFFSKLLIRMWVGPEVVPSLLLLVGLAFWAVLATGVSAPLAMFLNGTGVIRLQALLSVFMAIANLLLSIYLTRRIGISGVIYGSILAQIAVILIPFALYLPRLMSNVQVRVDPDKALQLADIQSRGY